MSVYTAEALQACLRAMLRPVARFCLRYSINVKTVLENFKVVFIDLAAEEMEERGEKVNVSLITTATGLYRRDVTRIYKRNEIKEIPSHFVGRVLETWPRNPKFTTSSGSPRVLTYEGEESEFNELVKHVTVDVHSKPILVLLERLGAVEKTKNGLKLVANGVKYYVACRSKSGALSNI